MSLKVEPGEQLSHVEDWTEGLDRVVNHWDDHLVVTKLVGLAVRRTIQMFLLVGKLIFILERPVNGLNLARVAGTAEDFLRRQ